MNTQEEAVIVMADDDLDDIMFTREALKEYQLSNDFRFVSDGAELLDYLKQNRHFANAAPRPQLILLDLNMPRMNGLEALTEIKKDPSLQSIPIVMLSTSGARDDIARSYDLGAASFIQKPGTYQGMVDAMRALVRYWFDIVALPIAPKP